MTKIIVWCNENNGFLTAILSVIGLLISTIAVVVSIRTAKLPFRKKLKLSSSTDIIFSQHSSGEVSSEVASITVSAANVGFRNVCITYLGLLVDDGTALHSHKQKMAKVRDEITGTGLILPSEVKTETFKRIDLFYALSRMNQSAKVYLCAQDTEGAEHTKKIRNRKVYSQKFREQIIESIPQ